MDSKKIGVLCVLLASVMWAIEPILVRLSYANSDFVQTTSIRVFFIALIAFAYSAARTKGNFKVPKKEFYVLFFIAISCTVLGELVFLYAIAKIPVVNVIMLSHLQPVFIAIIAFFILKKEKLSRHD